MIDNKYASGSLSDSLVRTLLHYIGEKYENFVTVFQIGANDGVRGDPINKFIKRYSWSAVIFEPVPSYFLKAEEAYASSTGVKVVNAAISNGDQQKIIYFVPLDKVPPDRAWEQGLASFDKEHLKRLNVSESRIEQVSVPVLDVNQTINKFRLNKVQLLVIDTEGHEGVIFDALDFSEFTAEVIIWESKHDSKSAKEIETKLKMWGYQTFHLSNDSVSIRGKSYFLNSLLLDGERLCKYLSS